MASAGEQAPLCGADLPAGRCETLCFLVTLCVSAGLYRALCVQSRRGLGSHRWREKQPERGCHKWVRHTVLPFFKCGRLPLMLFQTSAGLLTCGETALFRTEGKKKREGTGGALHCIHFSFQDKSVHCTGRDDLALISLARSLFNQETQDRQEIIDCCQRWQKYSHFVCSMDKKKVW